MSVSDRDYLRAGALHERGWTGSPVTWALMLANFGLWLVFAGSTSGMHAGNLYRLFADDLALHPSDVLARGRLWQPVTAMLVHDPHSIGPVLWNTAYLFFFGREVERMLGRSAYLRLYVLSGLATSLAAVAWATLDGAPGGLVMGASGCVFGILASFACRRPSEPVFWTVPAWAFCGALIAAQVSWFVASVGDRWFLAHVAGAGVGLLDGWAIPRVARARAARLALRARADRVEHARSETDDRRRVDGLLEKINREGIASLSAEEKGFLEAASKRFR